MCACEASGARTDDRKKVEKQERVLPSCAFVGAAVGRVPEDAAASNHLNRTRYDSKAVSQYRQLLTTSTCRQSASRAAERRTARGRRQPQGSPRPSCSRSRCRTEPAGERHVSCARPIVLRACYRLPNFLRVLRAKPVFNATGEGEGDAGGEQGMRRTPDAHFRIVTVDE